MANVSLRQVKKQYPNGFVAVKSIDLEIADKEFMVLVGPSGCGKTTTLRMIAGLEEISDGELYIGDKLVNDVDPRDRNIAMVFQNYALYPHMNVFKNMSYGLKIRKLPKDEIEKRVQRAAGILDIQHLLDRKPKQLSGGQRQRVALGRAIVRNPQVFLMDEPLSNLDAKLRVQMRAEIIKLHDDLKTTFVYVTHDQTEAMTMGTRICVMNEGEIQQVDTPKTIYNHPVNMFVAGFIGSPQMNFIEGVLREEGDGMTFAFEHYEDTIVVPLELTAEKKAKLAPYVGKEITVGVRPEHVHLGNEKPGFVAEVLVQEMLGSESYIHYKMHNRIMTLRAAPDNDIKIDERVPIWLDTSEMHFFDQETEENILN